MNTLSFKYKPNGSVVDYDYKLLVDKANTYNQTISGFVVSRLDKEDLETVTAGRTTKEINEKAYRTFNVEKMKNLKVV